MAKRIADKELTDRNWDQEEESEEAGTFALASDDVMKNRPIKKARRRNLGTESESSSAFKGFSGFAFSSSGAGNAAAAPAFGGFGNGASFKPLPSLTNGSSGSKDAPVTSAFSSSTTSSFPTLGSSSKPSSTLTGTLTFNGPSSAAPPLAVSSERQWNGSSSSSPAAAVSVGSSGSTSTSSSSTEYRRQLTALNCSVRDWIAKHVNDNPLCDLNPIFRDYERHLASIEKKYGGGGGGIGSGGTMATGTPAAPDMTKKEVMAEGMKPGGLQLTTGSPSALSSSSASSSMGGGAAPSLFSLNKEPPSSASGTTPTPAPSGVTFNFGKKVDSSVLASIGSGGAPSFSFSPSSSSTSSSAPSLFGGQSVGISSSAAFSFSVAKSETTSSSSTTTVPAAGPSTDANGAEEESEEPPVPVVREIKEKDAFYSKKCKLFYKKESEFKEKGVGTLHLKMVAEEKLQLLVRADTNLGNILLNIMVPSSMPCTRTGKNNVMVVCVPNPAVDEKNPSTPVPMLIRVKTAEDADELHKLLLEKKG